MCSSVAVQAQQQPTLLKPINVSQLGLLPTEKLDFWNRLNALAYKKSLSLVKVGDLPNLQQNGVLNFTIPGVAATLSSTAVRVEYETEKRYIWQGKVNQAGYMSMASTDDGVSGFVQLNNKYFVLYPLYKSYCALFEYDLPNMPIDSCAAPLASPNATDYCAEDNNCPALVDVLVLITPEARNWIGGGAFNTNWLNALAYVINGMETPNLAFANSNIPVRIRYRYANLSDFPYSSTPTDIRRDLDSLVLNPTANTLRNDYKADLVVMLTNDRYTASGVFGAVAGIGPDNPNAYAIVAINWLLDPRFTYAHEIGHLFGARHNRVNNCACGNGDDTGDCEHGWRFNDANGIERRTLLALLPLSDQAQGDQRLLHYSNPDISFNGTATGSIDDNNAHTISNTACTVSDFRSGLFSVVMNGFVDWCKSGQPDTEAPNNYSALVAAPAVGLPGTPPYTYEWRASTSGIFTPANPGTIIGNTATITINEPLACPFFFLRLRVTGSDGLSYFITRRINTATCTDCTGGKQALSEQTKYEDFRVVPNPANTDFSGIMPYVADGENYHLQLTDATGKTIEERKGIGSDASVTETFNTAHLAAGIYYVRVVSSDRTYCQKIIIHH